MDRKGQFFSPDMVIAIGVFIFSLALFWTASNVIFERVELFDSRAEADSVAHSIMDSLVLSAGNPADWEKYPAEDINSFGLVHSLNFIDANKVVSLVSLLNSENYDLVKQKMGAGKYDLQVNISDSKENVVLYPSLLSGGRLAGEPTLKANYRRIVYFNDQQLLLEVIVSIED